MAQMKLQFQKLYFTKMFFCFTCTFAHTFH